MTFVMKTHIPSCSSSASPSRSVGTGTDHCMPPMVMIACNGQVVHRMCWLYCPKLLGVIGRCAIDEAATRSLLLEPAEHVVAFGWHRNG